MTHIIPMLAGGLGNLLFQLAGGIGIAATIHGTFSFDHITMWQRAKHSSINYFDGFLAKWKHFYQTIRPTCTVYEHKLHPVSVPPGQTAYIVGYLQNYTYFWTIRDAILNLLTFENTDIVKNYPKLHESAFLHIRGGDYVGHSLHYIDLTNYYRKAIGIVQAPHYYVFTNDESFLKTQTWLDGINYTVVRENEIDSLYLMSQCQRGAICANSTFSWWGAFLKLDRPICMPSKWFNDPEYYIQGYFFPGVTVIEV
jgi:hypothetical protein